MQEDTAINHYNLGIIHLNEKHYPQAMQAFTRTLAQVIPQQIQLKQDAERKLAQIQQAMAGKEPHTPPQQNPAIGQPAQSAASSQQSPSSPPSPSSPSPQPAQKSARGQQPDNGSAKASDRRQNHQRQQDNVTGNRTMQHQPGSQAEEPVHHSPNLTAKQQAQIQQTQVMQDTDPLSGARQENNPVAAKSLSDQHTAQKTTTPGSHEQTNMEHREMEQGKIEQRQIEQWLRSIPDDPGELMRRKLLLEYQKKYGHTAPTPRKMEDLL